MANGKNKNHISVWFWLFALFVMALPCIGVIMIIVWAFVGDNESRKNYFKALIIWFLILVALWGTLMAIGLSPLVLKQLQVWLHRLQ